MITQKRINFYLLSFSLFTLFFVEAQTPISLNEVLEKGLAASHSIKINTYQAEGHKAQVNQAKLAYTPSLDVSGQAMLLNQPNIRYMGNAMAGMTSPKTAGFVMGSLKIPVFNGFQLRNNLRTAKELSLAEENSASLDSAQVAMQLINAYVVLFKASSSEKLVNENLANARQRESDFEKMKANGLLSENDFLKAQLQTSSIELSLVDVQNQLEMANYQLALLCDMDINTHFSIDTSTFYTHFLLKEQANIEEVKANRQDYLSLSHQAKALEYQTKLAKSAYYPHINLMGTYLTMQAGNVFSVTNMLNAGASLSFDIASFYKNPSKVAQAKSKQLEIAEQTEQLSDKILLEVHKSYLDYQKNTQRLALYEKSVQQAEENYRLIQRKNANNLATTTDLLEADLNLLQAKINREMARADVFLSYCDYLNVSGNLNQLEQQ